jgi:hypothetical protein
VCKEATRQKYSQREKLRRLEEETKKRKKSCDFPSCERIKAKQSTQSRQSQSAVSCACTERQAEIQPEREAAKKAIREKHKRRELEVPASRTNKASISCICSIKKQQSRNTARQRGGAG